MTYEEASRKREEAAATAVPDEDGDVPGHILIRAGRPGCTLTQPSWADPFWSEGILFCGKPDYSNPLTDEDLAANDWDVYDYYF